MEDGYQDSEYDSDSEEEGNDSVEDQGEDCHEARQKCDNFLIEIRTRSGRVIYLSHRVLASYQYTNQPRSQGHLRHFEKADMALRTRLYTNIIT